MRYSDGTTSSLHVTTIDAAQSQSQTPGLSSIFHPPPIPAISAFHQDPTATGYYTGSAPHPLITRLGSSTPSAGMPGHVHRSTALSGPAISAREQYAPDTPTYRRPSEHTSRSPSYPGGSLRRQPLSPTPSPIPSFTSPVRMEPGAYGPKPSGAVPPLGPINLTGRLEYVDGTNTTPAKCDINGAIDKGFFLADGEWTCYRRNYFSCNCSFSLTPSLYPGMPMQYVHEGTAYPVLGFAMSISAIVADDNNQTIELVQHTPKRDKGPVQKPEKIRLAPKQPHQHMNMYPHDAALGPTPRAIYDPAGFSAPQGPGSFQSEYTFERIQFKQATANNGKRRAAQQYYNLCVELWVECGGNLQDPFMKVAYRKSAKMIVRGRSPGHYSDNRRNSASSGPGGSAGSLTGFPTGGILGTEFTPSTGLPGSAYPPQYESRGGPQPPGVYNSMRDPRDILHAAVIPAEESKAIHTLKEYQYYPGATYEHQQDSRERVPVWNHPEHHGEPDNLFPPTMTTGFDHLGKIKTEGEGTSGGPGPSMSLRSLFNPGPLMSNRRCGPFEGKPSSGGYYPMMPAPGLGLNIT